MLSTRVKNPIITIFFYFCMSGLNIGNKTCHSNHLTNRAFWWTASLLQFENIFHFLCILSKWLESFVFSPHPLPHDKGLWSFPVLVHVFTYGSIPSVLYAFIPVVVVVVLGVVVFGGTQMWNWYICAAQGMKMEGLGSGPALKMGVGIGLSERPLTGKTGETKKRLFFLNEGLLALLRSEKRNKEMYIFEKGGLLERPRTKK